MTGESEKAGRMSKPGHHGPRRRPLGAHMSISGGLSNAVERARQVECTALQIFTKNQRRWQAPPLTEEDARAFREAYAASGLQYLCSHVSYLINLASSNETTRNRSREALVDEIQRAERLGCDCVVMHPGSPGADGLETGLTRISDGLRFVLGATRGSPVRIALENTCGQGARIGATIGQLGELLFRMAGHKRIALCLDTCHAFAAGIDWRLPGETGRVADQIEAVFGMERLAVIHFNDSGAPLGSRRDRHAHIPGGRIGEIGFAHLLAEPRFAGIPGVLETPKNEKTLAEDMTNLEVLRRLEAHVIRRGSSRRRARRFSSGGADSGHRSTAYDWPA